MQKGYEMVFLAFSQRWPVLLYGPAGAGKTALISKLAELHGARGMLFFAPCEDQSITFVYLLYFFFCCLIVGCGCLVKLIKVVHLDFKARGM